MVHIITVPFAFDTAGSCIQGTKIQKHIMQSVSCMKVEADKVIDKSVNTEPDISQRTRSMKF